MAVQIRFDARHSPNLPAAVVHLLAKIAVQKMTKEGVLVLTASEHRSQARNRKAAVERLAELIREACITPKYRRPTKPTFSSRLKRLEKKQRRGNVKKLGVRYSLTNLAHLT